jgi:hypothetical protein
MDESLATRLRDLHEVYVDAVNRALDEGREDLVAELAAEFPGEAVALMVRGAA